MGGMARSVRFHQQALLSQTYAELRSVNDAGIMKRGTPDAEVVATGSKDVPYNNRGQRVHVWFNDPELDQPSVSTKDSATMPSGLKSESPENGLEPLPVTTALAGGKGGGDVPGPRTKPSRWRGCSATGTAPGPPATWPSGA